MGGRSVIFGLAHLHILRNPYWALRELKSPTAHKPITGRRSGHDDATEPDHPSPPPRPKVLNHPAAAAAAATR